MFLILNMCALILFIYFKTIVINISLLKKNGYFYLFLENGENHKP